MTHLLFNAGHEFRGPDGMGYRLTRDAHHGDPVTVQQLEAFGGAPVPAHNAPIPVWLGRQIGVHRPFARVDMVADAHDVLAAPAARKMTHDTLTPWFFALGWMALLAAMVTA